MINPVVITYSTEMPERLRVSAERNEWSLEVMLDPGPYKGANHKFKQIIGSIPRLISRGFTHLISVDAFDTIITGNNQHFLGQLHSMNWPSLIVAAETNCYPDKTFEKYFPNTKTRWKYVNSPFILDLRQPIPEGFADIGDLDDQVHIIQWWLNNQHREGVILDTECRFFQTLYGVSRHIFSPDLQNQETGTYPVFFHGNGKADMSWLPNLNKVLINVATAGFLRDSAFMEHLEALHRPAGSSVQFVHGQSPAQARNLGIRQALRMNCTHILFVDDDVKIPADGLTRLLAHDKDVVSGLYLMKKWPHQPVIFNTGPDKKAKWHMLEQGEGGLIPIENAGLGCVLIKIEVFKKLPAPWITLGVPDPESWCDDISFFNKVTAAGFKMFCDLNVKCGHSGMVTFWPTVEATGQWYTTIDTVSPKTISTPQLSFSDYEREVDELFAIQKEMHSGEVK